MKDSSNKRIVEYDVLKGIAILIVCIGHIIQVLCSDANETKIYSLIFAVQMPLFIFISGYFSVNKIADSIYECLTILKKKMIVYMIPFFAKIVFSIIFDVGPENISKFFQDLFLTHIDKGLWYLWVILFLNISIILATYIRNALFIQSHVQKFGIILDCLLYFILLLPWLFIAMFFGSAVLGSKFVLYYSVFYLFGYLYKHYFESALLKCKLLDQVTAVVCIVCGIAIGVRMNFSIMPDTAMNVFLRFFAGLMLTYGMVFCVIKKHLWVNVKWLRTLGENSLEIYFVHGIAFSLLSPNVSVKLYSIEGQLALHLSMILTGLYTYLTIKVIHSVPCLNFIFFGKRMK